MRYANGNKLFSQHFRQSLDCIKTQRNLNTLLIGGPGTGKTRYFVWPNLMQANSSYIVFDPKGETFRRTAGYLSRQGYEVKAIDYIRLSPGFSHYNPFYYITGDMDVQRLATSIYKNTTPAGSKSNDPFWDQAGEILLKALMFMLWATADSSEQNFPMVLEMIRKGTVKEEEGNEDYVSPLDLLFEDLRKEDPEHLAVQYYDSYVLAAAKTKMSIQISLVARIEKFMLPSLQRVCCDDDLELESFGDRKTVLYCLVPDNDKSFNFIIGMLYTQLFQILYYKADWVHSGPLKVPVHFIMDEFANVHLPEDFVELLSTMRSRNIFVSMILQDITQLVKRYEKDWEAMVSGCDTILYLGGGGEKTVKFISGRLGKETITVDNASENKSFTHGSTTHSEQQAGRELMTEDELSRMDNALCLVFMRGERPIRDHKIILESHRCYKRMQLYEPLWEYLFTEKRIPGAGLSPQIQVIRETGEISKETPVFDLEVMTPDDAASLINMLLGGMNNNGKL